MQIWRSLSVPVAAISMSLLISFIIHSPSSVPNFYSDILGSFWGRDWVQSGSLPYLHSYFEYPVLSGLLLFAAKQVGSSLMGFYESFSAMSLFAGAVVSWSCWSIAKRMGKPLNPVYFVMPSFIFYGIYNFDLFHIMFVLLSIQSYLSGRKGLSAGFLGLGVDTKLVSVVLLPVMLLELKTNRERLKYAVRFGVVVAAFNLPFAIFNLSAFLQGYRFLGGYGLEDAWYVWIFQNPNTWAAAKVFGAVVSGLLLLRVYTLKMDLLPKVFLAVAAYLLGTYIYAPQFNLLLLPILSLVDFQHPALYLWDGFNALIILTWFIQPTPFLYGACPGGQAMCPTLAGTWVQLFALIRTGCLAWLFVRISGNEGHSVLPFLARVKCLYGGVKQVVRGLS